MNTFNMSFERLYPAHLRSREAKMLAERRSKLDKFEGSTDRKQISASVGTAEDDRVGVALSGGGIRSATFCLGVFQALCDANLLSRIDYLSTVSGGGYFGGFLGRLFTRPWIRDKNPSEFPPDDNLSETSPGVGRVQEVLKRRRSWCMRYLRDNGRYLSPNRAGDFWLAIAMYLRNWISMIAVLWTLVFALFALMTLVRALLWPVWPWSGTGFLSEVWLAERISAQLWWSPWLALPLLFFVLGIPAVVAYWHTLETWSKLPVVGPVHRWISWITPVFVLAVCLVPIFGPQVGLFAESRSTESLEIAAIAVGLVIIFSFVYFTISIFSYYGWKLDRIGLMKKPDRYEIRNSLGRALTALLKVSLVLLVVAFVDSLGQSAYAWAERREALSEPRFIVALLGVMGGLSGVVAFGQRLAAQLQRLPNVRFIQVPASMLAGLAGASLVLVLAGSASFANHMIAWRGQEPVIQVSADYIVIPGASVFSQDATEPSLRAMSEAGKVLGALGGEWRPPVPDPNPVLVGLTVSLILAILFGQTFGFFNLSSLHSFYSARLARAYLGASNPKRFKSGGIGMRVGKPISGDDIEWGDYRPWEHDGPLHLVNQTLNETVSGKTQIEYRDRKGLIMAQGPAGISVGKDDHAVWWPCKDDNGKKSKAGWRKRLTFVKPLNTEDKAFHALGLWVKPIGVDLLNTPDADKLQNELEKILGDKTLARRIRKYRDDSGQFSCFKELLGIDGIDDEKLNLHQPSVNLNTPHADKLQNELEKILGDKTLALKIRKYRDNSGRFSCFEELLDVDGVETATLENLRKSGVDLLNTPDADKLQNELEKILDDKKLALRIRKYRDNSGRFSCFEELLGIDGIDRETPEHLCKSGVTLDTPTVDELLGVDLNAPDADELQDGLVKILGDKDLALKIRKYRDANGNFNAFDDLTGIDGIGSRRLDDLAQQFNLLDAQPHGRETSVERCKLGRHVAISGAAFTTGTGHRTSIGTSLLAGLLNVRLGYWWTVDLTRRQREKNNACTRQHGPLARVFNAVFHVQSQLIYELTARFHGPAAQRWYLSDGGHFENTGAYELLRRRVPFIIVCDCGQDRDYKFSDVATLARQVRTDFGAELTILDTDDLSTLGVHRRMRELLGTPKDFAVPVDKGEKPQKVARRTTKHALLARVDFDSVDGRPSVSHSSSTQEEQNRARSYVLFLKPGLTGDEPHDVIHYQARKVDFPNESTLDQYFDEAQWESYRRIGVHIATEIFGDFRAADTHSRSWQPPGGWQPRDMQLNERMRA